MKKKDIKAEVNPTPTPEKKFQCISNWRNQITRKRSINLIEHKQLQSKNRGEKSVNVVDPHYKVKAVCSLNIKENTFIYLN